MMGRMRKGIHLLVWFAIPSMALAQSGGGNYLNFETVTASAG